MTAIPNLVTARISFDEAALPISGALVRVLLQEVTRSDAPAREVARFELPNYSRSPGEPPLEVSLNGGPIDPNARYELRVHVGSGGEGGLKAGDQINTQSHPVLTQGHPDRVNIQLRRVS
jgi:uncharacterized lipoprotein YbaY